MRSVMSWRGIAGFRLVAAWPERLATFYKAIGFTVDAPRAIALEEMALLGLAGGGTRWPLAFGPSRVDLDCFDQAGRAYPQGTNAASLSFQHLALVVGDVTAAWQRARAAGAVAIGSGSPVTLPASAGGVTAIKFRDPEGHPLEFIHFPGKSDTSRIDHSALSVHDVAASGRSYRERGLSTGETSLNQGPTQAALDGLDRPCVDVVPMLPQVGTPHVELLGYRHPAAGADEPPAVADIAATRIVWDADATGLMRDPDGHLHQTQAN